MKPLLVVDRGEFGWSLCALAPRARAMAQAGREVHVVAPRDRWPLFDDFATAFEAAVPEPGTQDFLSGGLLQPSAGDLQQLSAGFEAWPSPNESAAIVKAERASFAAAAVPVGDQKAWRRFGAAAPRGRLVCVAFRPPKLAGGKVHAWKAWPEQRCAALVREMQREGWRVVAIGGPDNWAPEGCEDARGCDLHFQAGLLSEAACCVGPSSGTLHFGQQCGAPVVTWYDAVASSRASSESRYRLAWNPFRAPLQYLRDRCPEVPEAFAAVEGFMAEVSR